MGPSAASTPSPPVSARNPWRTREPEHRSTVTNAHLRPGVGGARRPRLPVATAFLFLLAGCADEEPRGADGSAEVRAASAPAIVDAAGRTFATEPLPGRIVSLVPSATETLIALGAGELLVGRTEFDTARALAHLPSVGGGLGPSVEVLVSLRPDLVIRFAGQADVRTPTRLDALGVPHFAVRPDRVEDVRAMIRDLGRLTGRTAEAERILSTIDRQVAAVRDRVRDLPPKRVAFLLDGSPAWAAGPSSFIGELINLGGGLNVFRDIEREYAPVSPEALVARNIDVVLTVRGSDPGGVPESTQVRTVSPLTQLPGPRLGEAAEEIARALHPEAFR